MEEAKHDVKCATKHESKHKRKVQIDESVETLSVSAESKPKHKEGGKQRAKEAEEARSLQRGAPSNLVDPNCSTKSTQREAAESTEPQQTLERGRDFLRTEEGAVKRVKRETALKG